MLNYYLRCLPYILQHNAVVSLDVVEWCCTCVLWVVCVSCSLCLESILLQWLKASRTLISGSEGNYITLQRGNNKIWIFISTERDRRSVKLIADFCELSSSVNFYSNRFFSVTLSLIWRNLVWMIWGQDDFEYVHKLSLIGSKRPTTHRGAVSSERL